MIFLSHIQTATGTALNPVNPPHTWCTKRSLLFTTSYQRSFLRQCWNHTTNQTDYFISVPEQWISFIFTDFLGGCWYWDFCWQWFCRNLCILSKGRTGFYVIHLYCELLWFSLILSIWCEGLDKLFFFQHLLESVSQLILSLFVYIQRSLRYGGGSTTWRGSIPSQ